MKKSTIIGISMALGLIGLMLWGRSNQTVGIAQNSGEINSLMASEKLYDFGAISMANGNVSKVFTITNANATNEAVTIKNIETSCMCTTAYMESASGEKGPFGMPGHGGGITKINEVIKAGESREVKVVYDPNAHGPAGIGPVDRFVYLTDTSGSTLVLEIKAVVTP